MNEASDENSIIAPALDVLSEKNILSCLYSDDIIFEKECSLFIDTSKLSFVNKNILYTIADVYCNNFSFGNDLVDDLSMYYTYHGKDKRNEFSKYRYACFHFPNYGDIHKKYMIGFFLEFANCFVEQEPFPLFENVYNDDLLERYYLYLKKGMEDKKKIVLLVSLGKDHPSKLLSDEVQAAIIKFDKGEIVPKHGKYPGVLSKDFCLTTERALVHHDRYVLKKNQKEKVKTKNEGVDNE